MVVGENMSKTTGSLVADIHKKEEMVKRHSVSTSNIQGTLCV